MSATPILSTPVASTVEALGWTLLHFVWQGAVVALALWIVLFLARKASPQVRYLAGCGALCLMCIAAGSTFVWCLDGSRLGTAESPAVAQADSAMLSAVSSSGVLPPARTDTADLRDNARDTTEAPIVAHSVRVEEAPAVSQVSVVSSDALKSLPEAAARWGQRLEPWLPGIVALWALGVAFLSLRLLAGWRAVRRLRATAQEIPDEAWNPRFSRLKERLGVLYPVRLVCSASAGVPMVIGWLKPAVILPAGLITGLSPEQLEAILAHELIHIRRHDYLVNLLQNVVETLLFYHPAVAWVSKRIRVEREHCCDDAALLVSGGVLDYARALAALAELRRSPALGVAATGGSVVERIRRLSAASASDARRTTSTPLPTLLLLLTVLGALAAIAGVTWAQQKRSTETLSPDSAAEMKTRLLPSHEEHVEGTVLRGQVLQPDGRPAAGARVAAFRYDLQFTPRPNRPPLASTTADHDGRFELTLPKSQFRNGTGRPNPLRVGFILAEADGFGFQAVDWAAIDAAQPLTLKLTPDFPIRGRVVDLEGRPVPGVTVVPTHVNESQTGSLDLWLGAVKAGHPSALSWELGKLNWIAAFDDQPNRTMTTDSDGRFTLTGIGPERLVGLELRGESTAFTFVNVATRPMRPLTRLLLGLPVPRKDQVFGSEFTCQVNPSRVIVGTVSDAATGEPLKGVGVAGDRWGRMWTETDAQGRYRLVGVPKGRGSQIMAFPNDDQPYFLRGLEVPDGPGIGPITVDFKLHRGLWITGRVIDQVTRQPVMARLHYLPFLDNRFLGKLPEFGEGGLSVSEMRYTTRPNGTFRLVGLPGRAIVGALSLSPHYRTGQGAEQINGVDKNGHFPTFSNPAPAGLKWPTAIKEINPAEGSDSVKCDFVLESGGKIQITLVDREGKPVQGATVSGRVPMEVQATVDSKFDVANLSPNETRPVVIFDKQRDIGKVLMLMFDEKTPRTMTVTLEPSATVTGRIVDEDGAPVTAAGLLAFPLPGGDFWPTLPPGAVQADGRFEYRGLLAGAECRIMASPPDLYPQTLVDKFTVQPGKTIDLGEIKLKRRGLADVGFSKPKNPVPAPKTPSAEAVKPPGRPATPSPKENTAQSDAPAVIHGTVLRPDGKPATDATVSLYAFHWSSGDRIRWEPIASRGTNSHGEFELVAPPSDASGSDDKFFFATAKGLGCDYQLHFSLDPSKPLVMKLAPDRPIRGRILDLEGKPVAGARVRVVTVTDSADRGVGPWIDAMRSGVERYSSAAHSLLGKFVKTLPGGAGSTTTDQDGRFVLQGLGAERVVDLAIESDTTAYRQVTVVTRSLDPIIRPAAARGAGLEIFGADFTTSASPTRPVVGTVRDEKTGKPLEGVSIESRRFASESFAGQRGLRTTSDAQGKYRLLGMPKGIGNAIFVVPNDEQPYFMRQLEVPDPSGIEPVTVDIQLHRGLWITGRVTDKETGKPVRARVNYWPFLTNTHAGGLPEFGPGRNMQGDDARYPTRPDGTFRVPGLPGRGLVGAEAMVDHYRQGAGASEIHDVDREGRLRTYRNQGWPSLKYPTTMKEINPTDGTESIICNLVCDHGETVWITVLDPDGKPVSNCSTSVASKNGKARGIDSPFELNNLPLNVEQPLLIEQKERKLAKFVTFTLKEQSPRALTVQLEPCAQVIGRLLDEDGTPLKGVSVDPRLRRSQDYWPTFPAIVCRSDGRFEYPSLPAGATFYFWTQGAEIEFGQSFGRLSAAPGKKVDLGDITLKRRR
jgi:beta-lactamase regulating signal transducer with metallopeptidase domain